MEKFKKHFRLYFRNGHPAYIVDEEGNMYVFHRITHSNTSGGRNNIRIDNPLVKGGDQATYIVKRTEKDKKGRFSLFELELKPGIDIDNLLIKKAGGSQTDVVNIVTTSIDDGKSKTLTHKSDQSSKIIKSKGKKKGKRKRWKIRSCILALYVGIPTCILLDISMGNRIVVDAFLLKVKR